MDEISNITPKQKRIIKNYTKNIDIILDIIVVVNSIDKSIIDGYHRLASFHLSGIKTIYIGYIR